jgi:hypothetical protein
MSKHRDIEGKIKPKGISENYIDNIYMAPFNTYRHKVEILMQFTD